MKYYQTKIKSSFPEVDKILGYANGVLVENRELYFPRISNSEVIYDAPVFDYFYLQTYDPKEDAEWRLQDVHGFSGEYPAVSAWYVSDRFKELITRHNIAKAFHFYATKLKFKDEKLAYWMFHYGILGHSFDPNTMIDFNRSIFL
ncbi:hypothetical protein [Pseudochryseolinea flava]|uniref:Uncharacterized protein n=1 Tax=Pseudochryseolinea flava TaxID=2059302 RepID=A0A364Y675_9BACT|nr:hypothetical protein [Pseudochryseolinea flava]RAW02586.1 hypothetical protein DQQ10_00265 [Pseudochryseolinea flava]